MKARFLALTASFSLAACAAAPSGPGLNAASLVGTSWSQGIGSNAPRLNFATASSVNGSGGCNSFTGPAELAGDKLLLGPLAATKRACVGPPQQVEDAFFRALRDTRSVRIDKSQLVLLNAAGQEVARLDRLEKAER